MQHEVCQKHMFAGWTEKAHYTSMDNPTIHPHNEVETAIRSLNISHICTCNKVKINDKYEAEVLSIMILLNTKLCTTQC